MTLQETVCPTANGATLVGLLLSYQMESKEFQADLLDAHLVLPALDVI